MRFDGAKSALPTDAWRLSRGGGARPQAQLAVGRVTRPATTVSVPPADEPAGDGGTAAGDGSGGDASADDDSDSCVSNSQE